jgi:hypothetical protein
MGLFAEQREHRGHGHLKGLPVALVAGLLWATPAWAQTQTPPPAGTPPTQTTQSSSTQQPPGEQAPPTALAPDHLDRIRQSLSHESMIRLDNGQKMIYVEVIAKWPTFAEIAKGYDLMNGPTGFGNPMSHQEFLNMVTPKEMYGSGGITAPEMLVMALENYFGQKYISKGLKDISEARDQKRIEQIRARIDAELAALTLKGGGQ